jgi:hypothetical protein
MTREVSALLIRAILSLADAQERMEMTYFLEGLVPQPDPASDKFENDQRRMTASLVRRAIAIINDPHAAA